MSQRAQRGAATGEGRRRRDQRHPGRPSQDRAPPSTRLAWGGVASSPSQGLSGVLCCTGIHRAPCRWHGGRMAFHRVRLPLAGAGAGRLDGATFQLFEPSFTRFLRCLFIFRPNRCESSSVVVVERDRESSTMNPSVQLIGALGDPRGKWRQRQPSGLANVGQGDAAQRQVSLRAFTPPQG